MKPVSVVVITADEEKNIAECLDSLCNMNYPKYEILVVDASSDSTPIIVKKYKNVKFISTRNKGFAAQRNLGIRYAKYPLIAFTDADCIIPKNWLHVLISNINGKIAGVGGNAFSPKKSPFIGKCIACLGFPAGGDIGFDAIADIEKTMHTASVATCNAVFRKDILKSIGGFNENLRYGGEDSDLCRKINRQGWFIDYVPQSFVFHKPRDSIRSLTKWCFRRGIAKYYLHKTYFYPMAGIVLTIGIASISYFIFKKSIFSVYIFASLCAAIFSMFIFTKRFRMLIMRRKRIKISMPAIIFAVIPLELLKQASMFAGYNKELIKNGFRLCNKK